MGLVLFSGCPKPQPNGDGFVEVKGPCAYAAQRVHIIGLTSVKPDPNSKSSAVISTYVSLHDSFDSSVKGPGIFRFELYEYVPRSSQPRGKRLFSWPEFDLNDATINNSYWKDFLRAYYFSLNATIDLNVPKTYILQVTCVTPAEKRLTDIFYVDIKID